MKKQHNYKYNKKYKKLGIFNRGNKTAQSRRYRKKYPQKVKAHRICEYARLKKILILPNKCQLCKSQTKVEGHHRNYKQPLKVIWVCWKCHNKIHKKIRH